MSIHTELHYVPDASSLDFELNRVSESGNNLNAYDYVVDIVLNGKIIKSISYAEFRKHLENRWSYNKIRRECDLSPFRYFGLRNSTIILGILAGVFFVLFLVTLICCLG